MPDLPLSACLEKGAQKAMGKVGKGFFTFLPLLFADAFVEKGKAQSCSGEKMPPSSDIIALAEFTFTSQYIFPNYLIVLKGVLYFIPYQNPIPSHFNIAPYFLCMSDYLIGLIQGHAAEPNQPDPDRDRSGRPADDARVHPLRRPHVPAQIPGLKVDPFRNNVF